MYTGKNRQLYIVITSYLYIMTTIAASEEGYKKVMAKKQEMENETDRVVSMKEALDELLRRKE